MKYLTSLVLALSLVGCYPHYRRADFRPDTCPPAEVMWLDTVPEIDPIDAACLEYERRTGRDVRPLMARTHLIIRKHSGDPHFCTKLPYQTCTGRIAEHTYIIEYKDDAQKGQYLWHEIFHVLLWEAGYPTGTHHKIMDTRGWL